MRGSRDWRNALPDSEPSPPNRRARHGDRAGRDFSHNIDNEQIPGWARGWDGRTGTLKGTLHNVPWAERVADDEQVAERAREILKRLPQVV